MARVSPQLRDFLETELSVNGLGLYFASRRLSVEILIISDYLTHVLLLSWIEAFLLSLRLMRRRPLAGPVSPWCWST